MHFPQFLSHPKEQNFIKKSNIWATHFTSNQLHNPTLQIEFYQPFTKLNLISPEKPQIIIAQIEIND